MYKIEITEINRVMKKTSEWQRLHDRKEFESDEDPQYGYVTTKNIVKTECKIYEQEVKSIDLKRVIKAINEMD